jgi:GT2 family glycosyltransferase
MQNLISILVLSYNNLEYFPECINSILEQTYENIEIVLSDDCSTNFNKDTILKYIDEKKNKNIKSIVLNQNKKNIGVVKNFNKAIRLGKGEYFFYLAADDCLYDKNVIKDVIEYFEDTKLLIFTGYKAVYSNKLDDYVKKLPRKNEVEFLKKESPGLLYEKLCLGSFISGSNTPFSRKFIEEYGYLDETYEYLEDYPRYLKISKLGCKIGFYERTLIKYRMGGVTTNGVVSEKLRQDLKNTVFRETRDFIKKTWNNEWLLKKKIVGWGTGDCLLSSLEELDCTINYLIDSNKDLQGKMINNINICNPAILEEENKDDIFILVFSYSNYYEISPILDSYGFIEKKHYFCCNPFILKLLKED